MRIRAYASVEDEQIRACWQHGRNVAELARTLGRSPGSVRLRAQKLGVHRPAPRRRWQAYEDAAVRDGYELGLSCAQIAAELPGRTPSAVAARAAKLGVANYARAWTALDDRLLRAFTRDSAELERAAHILTRTPEALRARARKLGLAPLRSRRSGRAARPWTLVEDEQLRLHAGLNPGLLAELLARSPESVVQRLRRLGLRDMCKRSPHHPARAGNGLTPGERASVLRELRSGGPRRQLALAKRLGRTPAEIQSLSDRRAPKIATTHAGAGPAGIASWAPTGRVLDLAVDRGISLDAARAARAAQAGTADRLRKRILSGALAAERPEGDGADPARADLDPQVPDTTEER